MISGYAGINGTHTKLGNGPWLRAQEVTVARLAQYQPDSLLYTFNQVADIAPLGPPPSGWQAPSCELRGHFTGHYLSASARAVQCGYTDLRPNLERVVHGLRSCQNAIGSGYLSGFPESLVDQVIAGEQVWAPWYTLHKIGQGLLDAHVYADVPFAGTICQAMILWINTRVKALSDGEMQRMLVTEHGGMTDFLVQAANAFSCPIALALAQRFVHQDVVDAIDEEHWDWFVGRHANTQIPIVIGMAQLGFSVNNTHFITLARRFVDKVLSEWTYPNGGNSDLEHFGALASLHKHLSAETSETCNTHNLAKLIILLSTVGGCKGWDSWLNGAIENHLLAARAPNGSGLMYYFPLSPGATKKFDTANHDFWCCSGTGIETPFHLPNWIIREDITRHCYEVIQPIPCVMQTPGGGIITVQPVEHDGRVVVQATQGISVVLSPVVSVSSEPRWVAFANDPTTGSFFCGNQLIAFSGPAAPLAIGCIIADVLNMLRHANDGRTVPPDVLTIIPPPSVPVYFKPISLVADEAYSAVIRGFETRDTLSKWSADEDAHIREQAALDRMTFDKLTCGDTSSEMAHETHVEGKGYSGKLGTFSVRDIRAGGALTTRIMLPHSGPYCIAITYWGGEFRRTFTVEIGIGNTYVQTLDHDNPGKPVTFIYPIHQNPPISDNCHVVITASPGGYAGLLIDIRSICMDCKDRQRFK